MPNASGKPQLKAAFVVLILSLTALGAVGPCLGYSRNFTSNNLSRLLPVLNKLKLHTGAHSFTALDRTALETLDLSNSDVSVLPRLPKTLRYLVAGDLQLRNIGKLPRDLFYLDIRGTSLTKTTPLPPNLHTLLIDAQALPYLPLPPSLRVLSVDYAYLQTFRPPTQIRHLSLNQPVGMRWNVELPPHLQSLSINNDTLESLPRLPSSLLSVSIVRDNGAPLLKFAAPRSLQVLVLDRATVTNWGDLSRSLTSLNLSSSLYPRDLSAHLATLKLNLHGQPFNVQSFPASLTSLSLLGLAGGHFPQLPQKLEELKLTGADVSDFRFLTRLKALSRLTVANQRTINIGTLPRGLKSLTISGIISVKGTDAWPDNLHSLTYQRASQDFLASLPPTVQSLNIDETDGIHSLPPHLHLNQLSARGSALSRLDLEPMGRLQDLDLCGSAVKTLPKLPPSVKRLSVSLEQLTRIDQLRELRVLIVRKNDECIDGDTHRWLEVCPIDSPASRLPLECWRIGT